MLLHKKNDRREANSRSLMRYTCPGLAPAGSFSTRNTNAGIESSPSRARPIPASNSPSLRPRANRRINSRISTSVSGRRYARRAKVVRICRAQLSSSFALDGRHTRILRRLGVSSGTFGAYGPATSIVPIAGALASSKFELLRERGRSGTISSTPGAVSVNVAAITRAPAFTAIRKLKS